MRGSSTQTSGCALHFCIINRRQITAIFVFCKQTADFAEFSKLGKNFFFHEAFIFAINCCFRSLKTQKYDQKIDFEK